MKNILNSLRVAVATLLAHHHHTVAATVVLRKKDEGAAGAAKTNTELVDKSQELEALVKQRIEDLYEAYQSLSDPAETVDNGSSAPSPTPRTMRAKMRVSSLSPEPEQTGYQMVRMTCVCKEGGYGQDGLDENNSFAKWSPSGSLELTIANPDLFGKIKLGEEYYLDFLLAKGAEGNVALEEKKDGSIGILGHDDPDGPIGEPGPVGPSGQQSTNQVETQVEPRTGQTMQPNADPTVSDPKNSDASAKADNTLGQPPADPVFPEPIPTTQPTTRDTDDRDPQPARHNA